VEEKQPRPERPLGGAQAGEHSLTVSNREHVEVMGVLSVESFDDEEIILETDLGTLTLRGEELSIKQLDLETGRFSVDGYIQSCTYSAPRPRGPRGQKPKGLLERLLR
jgi:sporulation protein YabP